jgi:dUTP pyrophosphatase
MDIKIKYTDKDLKPIDAAHKGEWIDLRSAETVEMNAGEFRKIRLGVAMQLPPGYEAIIAPRSSTFDKWGIIFLNSIGIIDNLYCGDNDEWHVAVMALRKTKIYKNDRICQFRILHGQPSLKFVEVDKMDAPDRGGFGSTGVD